MSSAFGIDKRSMTQLKRGLNKMFPKDKQSNNAITKGMVKASRPMAQGLRSSIRKNAKDTGKLAKSIRIFKAKRLDKFGRPSVFIGPLVKVPKRIKKKKGRTIEQRKADSDAWIAKKSGYYFYFLEYGFGPRGSNKKVAGLGLLPKVASEYEGAVLGSLEMSIIDVINKKAMRELGYKLV